MNQHKDTATQNSSLFTGMLALICVICVASVVGLFGCSTPTTTPSNSADNNTASPSQATEEDIAKKANELRIGSMKGPTSVGIAAMMQEGEGEFTVVAAADELTGLLLQDELDIALLPANVAATLYERTEGEIQVIDINALGVLYAVSADKSITAIEDLRGRTVYMTGQNSIPEYTVRALLEAAGLSTSDVDLQFRSEAAEVAALIAQNDQAVGILPEPYATSTTMKNDTLAITINLTQAWEQATGGDQGSFITGVTVAKADTIANDPDVIAEFLKRHKRSAAQAVSDPASVADKIVELEIIPNAQVAEQAIPHCNVVCWTGSEMKEALSGFLTVLYNQDPAAIGGTLPSDDFYYLGNN